MEEPLQPLEPIEPSQATQNPPQRKWTLWLALSGLIVLLCGAIFAGALILFGSQIPSKFLPSWVRPTIQRIRGETQNNTMGDPNAPVHIIEYGDFQCPYCLKFWQETEPQLIEKYVNTGKVYFEFRAFPIIGPESYSAAEGAYCAGDQGKFWEYHDTLFSNWTGENVGDFTEEKLIKYAESLNLDMAAFKSCISEGKYKEKVEQDLAQGEADHVEATPTFFINGNKVVGVQPIEVIDHIIHEILDGDINTVSG